tara:strand:- start:10839 stop:12008 length:1170 start_codon:yes stop_codon:yes gene_type:complete
MCNAKTNLENVTFLGLLFFVGALQISIAISAILLTIILLLWLVLIIREKELPKFPIIFWPLLAYAAVTMVSVVASTDPMASLFDSKEILLFLVVPLVYRLARGESASAIATTIISVGGAAAIYGIVQYGILNYDNLGQRPQGSMGHYMTFSGLLMLVICLATARVLFDRKNRTWSSLVLPALIVALTLTFTRSAWVGACAGISLLFVLKDFRLIAVIPILAAAFFVVAPEGITERVYSMFDLQDPTNRDRVAMARIGVRMVSDHPLTGVGPDMVKELYSNYRDETAVNETNPHLHNVPLHIAAERGLPALGIWLWFIAVVIIQLARIFKDPLARPLAAGGLAAIASMLSAGMFEYNFGDSEFLMLLLVLITLPAAITNLYPSSKQETHS